MDFFGFRSFEKGQGRNPESLGVLPLNACLMSRSASGRRRYANTLPEPRVPRMVIFLAIIIFPPAAFPFRKSYPNILVM
jgi:hypothetical protein